ncbi:CHAP domain-containing protein, partial [Listeria monocytogenes]|nr:CHAP domain-containing protein [Listeria monocytogenes]
GGDPMQSSESLGLPPNTIKDPERSIQRGVEFFVENMKSAINRGSDIKTALQAYNYGGGFVDFVVKNGGTYSFELAKQFSINMSGGEKVPYVNALSTSMGYNYRYNYGNMFYVPKLLEYVNESQASAEGVQNNSNNTGVVQVDVPSEYKNKLRYPRYDGHNYNTSGSYPFGQCTWYAFNRMAQIGKPVDDFMGNGGEWGYKGKALGYKVTNKPKVGTAISFPPGSFGSDPVYGHVAFVEVVNADGTLLVSECNVVNPGSGTISYRVVPASIANIASYVE